MANRYMTQEVMTELAGDQIFPFYLLDIFFDEEIVRITTLYQDYTVEMMGAQGLGEVTYIAVGHFLRFSDVEESAESRVARLTLELSGVDQTNISRVLSYDYINRRLILSFGLVNRVTYKVMSDPFIIFDGLMSGPVISDDPQQGNCIVSLECTDVWEDFERTPGRHTNHDEEQLYYPGDLGFEFVAKIPSDLKWGRK